VRRLVTAACALAVLASLLTLTTAAQAARPTLSVGKAISGQSVVFRGAAGAATTHVVLQHRVRGRWVETRAARVGRDRRFAITEVATLGREQVRVVVGGRPSRVVTVDPEPDVTRNGSRFVLSGRLPTSVRREVVLQRRTGSRWVPVVSRRARRSFLLSWTATTRVTVRVVAPRQTRTVGTRRVVDARVTGAVVVLIPRKPTPIEPTDPTMVDLTPGSRLDSSQPDVSGDGQFVAFTANAPLTRGDHNLVPDVYVRDRETGVTELVSASEETGHAIGGTDPDISADGRFVAFVTAGSVLAGTPAQPSGQVFLHDRQTGATRQVSASTSGLPNGGSWGPSVSAHGEYVAFSSVATNLVFGMDDNGTADVFRRSVSTGSTIVVSATRQSSTVAGNDTSLGASISADGSRVAYSSWADDVADAPASASSRIVLWDANVGHGQLISTDDTGTPANDFSGLPAISGDGTAVVFVSTATNLGLANPAHGQQVYLWRETWSGLTGLSSADGVAAGEIGSSAPTVNADGSRVAFLTLSASLLPGFTTGNPTIVLWESGQSRLHVTRGPHGAGPDDANQQPALSADGHTLVFVSEASDLAIGQVKGVSHVLAATIP
jgi:Tol biopolymer transport system component